MAKPKVLNTYFESYGSVDANNHVRQGNLVLEEFWVTSNPYFRNWTMIVGMCVTYLWYLHKKQKEVVQEDIGKACYDQVAFALVMRVEQFENEEAGIDQEVVA